MELTSLQSMIMTLPPGLSRRFISRRNHPALYLEKNVRSYDAIGDGFAELGATYLLGIAPDDSMLRRPSFAPLVRILSKRSFCTSTA